MGINGAQLTKDTTLMGQLPKEKIDALGSISIKKIFGGDGIFYKGKTFGIVDSEGQAFFKINDSNKLDFEEYGVRPHERMPYYEVPDKILNDT